MTFTPKVDSLGGGGVGSGDDPYPEECKLVREWMTATQNMQIRDWGKLTEMINPNNPERTLIQLRALVSTDTNSTPIWGYFLTAKGEVFGFYPELEGERQQPTTPQVRPDKHDVVRRPDGLRERMTDPGIHASTLLNLAGRLVTAGKLDVAKRLLEGLCKDFPGTAAAKEAEKLLAAIDKNSLTPKGSHWISVFGTKEDFDLHWKPGLAMPQYRATTKSISILSSRDMGSIDSLQPWTQFRFDITAKLPPPPRGTTFTYLEIEINVNGARFPVRLRRGSSPAEPATISFTNQDGRITARADRGAVSEVKKDAVYSTVREGLNCGFTAGVNDIEVILSNVQLR
jgi:hypothetical protein